MAVPVWQLPSEVDKLAKQYRQLDLRIQQLNWKTELIGALLQRISGAALSLVFAGAILMVIHNIATGLLWFWITARGARAVYDRRIDAA